MSTTRSEYALTATKFAPAAQWAMRGVGAARLLDRSGNGRHLVTELNAANPCPDGKYNNAIYAGGFVSAVEPALNIVGDLTVTVRAWARASNDPYQVLAQSNDGTGVAGPWTFFGTHAGQLSCSVETTTQDNYQWDSALEMPWGRWAFLSLRRDTLAGRWTLGVDGAYETSPVLPVVTVPLNGSYPKIYVGRGDVGPYLWAGGYCDLSIWPVRLTDAQLNGLRKDVGL